MKYQLFQTPKPWQRLEFFIKAASLMEENEIDHVHLQDKINGFDYRKYVDIILLNKEIIKIEK